MLVNTKAKIGVFSIALGAYLPQFPQLVPNFEAQYEDFKKTIPDTVEIIDGGMVTTKEQAMAAGLPQCIVALHSLITDQDILHGVVQCMTHVELSGDIWGRDHDSEGSLTVIYLRMKILFVKPLLIQSVFYAVWVIGFG